MGEAGRQARSGSGGRSEEWPDSGIIFKIGKTRFAADWMWSVRKRDSRVFGLSQMEVPLTELGKAVEE